MKITILFKSGKEIDVECDEFSVGMGLNAKMNSYEIKGALNGRPIYINMDEVACIYRKEVSEESEEEE